MIGTDNQTPDSVATQRTSPLLYTVGHSNHPIERFLGLLETARVQAIADVRSVPYSRFNPQFNKQRLRQSLTSVGIVYVYLGGLLGGQTQSQTSGHRPDYAAMVRTPDFARGIDRLLRGAAMYRVAIMCAERDPNRCHRTHLITPALLSRGAQVVHLLHTGECVDARADVVRSAGEDPDLFREGPACGGAVEHEVGPDLRRAGASSQSKSQ